MNLFRRRATPLASDSTASLTLPRVRMGLLTKLNLLTIGLIFLTAIGTTGYYVWQQWHDETNDVRERGATALAMLAELSEFGLHTSNREYLDAILESLSAEGDVAYAVIVDRKGDVVAGRRISDALGKEGPPATPADAVLPPAGATSTTDVTIRGRRYVELIAPVSGTKIATAMGLNQGPPEPPVDNAVAAAPPGPRWDSSGSGSRSTGSSNGSGNISSARFP